MLKVPVVAPKMLKIAAAVTFTHANSSVQIIVQWKTEGNVKVHKIVFQ